MTNYVNVPNIEDINWKVIGRVSEGNSKFVVSPWEEMYFIFLLFNLESIFILTIISSLEVTLCQPMQGENLLCTSQTISKLYN